MGLAPLIVVLESPGLRRNDRTLHQAARLWARVFSIRGVLTGIPVEFQFGTNSLSALQVIDSVGSRRFALAA